MITYNDVAPLAQKLRIFTQKFKEALVSYLEAKQGSSDVILSGVEQLDKADVILQGLEKKEAAIATDARLSSVGRQEQMAKVAAEFHQQLRFVGNAAKDRRAAAEQLRRTFTAVPKSQYNETTDFLMSSEIRQRLAPLSMSERMQVLAKGNAQVLRAVMLDPLGEPLVDAEFLDRLQQTKAQATDGGKEWVRMESLVFVAERLDQLTTAIDLQLSNYNERPSFPGKPTRTTDLAYTDQTAPPARDTAIDQAPAGVTSFQ
jgi:hypothetical protein